jgi:hypothetical protein
MAYASKTEKVVVRVGKKSQGPWFGFNARHVPFHLVKIDDVSKREVAKAHLKLALRRYEEALKLAPDHFSANLGYGWCLQQAGKKDEAVAQYRKTIAIGWAVESKGLGFRHSVVDEASSYLIPLLDPEKDRAELDTLKRKVKKLRAFGRRVTPLAVPLSDGLEVEDLIDLDARVQFDADGSGKRSHWSWITGNAAWLVYIQKDGDQVTSALQMFGNVTFWLFWSNGYEALATLDDNADGRLDGAELRHLALWRDVNGNGISEPGELTSLTDAGIISLSCQNQSHPSPGCQAYSQDGITFRNGTTRHSYDLLLYPQKSAPGP